MLMNGSGKACVYLYWAGSARAPLLLACRVSRQCYLTLKSPFVPAQASLDMPRSCIWHSYGDDNWLVFFSRIVLNGTRIYRYCF